MTDSTLDRMDARIVAVLRKDGRISHQQLSTQVGLSPSQCLRRVKRLEDEGIIRGYTAIIDESKLGNDVSAWILVTLDKAARPGARERVAVLLQNRPWVRVATGVTGDVDFMIRVVAPRMADFTRILVDELNGHADISSTQSFICLDDLVRG
ncbi:Lrp/AsnC family transcriptional regulator [Pseudomonas sp. 3A(2025)]